MRYIPAMYMYISVAVLTILYVVTTKNKTDNISDHQKSHISKVYNGYRTHNKHMLTTTAAYAIQR